MEWIQFVVAAVFALLGIGCLVLVALSLPGTWIMIALAAAIEALDQHYLGGSSPTTFGWGAIAGCAALAGLGEGLEGMTGAAGVKAGGGSKRGMFGAMLGGFAGAIVFTPLIPIPVIGTLLGALIGTFLGALIAESSRKSDPVEGAAPGDQSKGEALKRDLKAAGGATVGRLIGTMAKTALAICVWVSLTVLAFWP